jgi:hypothetical protein
VWALSRRTGLFIVSYFPLALMFVVLRWPSGWSAAELIRLGVLMVAFAALALTGPASVAVTGKIARWLVRGALCVAVGVAIFGVLKGWLVPLALKAPEGRTTATACGVAVFFATMGLGIVALILYNARRAGSVRWTVSDPADQGAAIAGYLASYLLPLLSIAPGGWRVTAAYALYIGVLYLVYVRTESLVLINPTLYLFGYRIYDVSVEVSTQPPSERRVLLLTKLKIETTIDVSVLPLGDNDALAFRHNDRQ